MDKYQLNRSQGRPYNRTCGMMNTSSYAPIGSRTGRSGNCSGSQDSGGACQMPGTSGKNRELLTQVQELPDAMAYVPCQEFSNTFDLCYAFRAGTIFPSLCKPFCGKGRCSR